MISDILRTMHSKRNCVLLAAFTVVVFYSLVSTTSRSFRDFNSREDFQKDNNVAEILGNEMISTTTPVISNAAKTGSVEKARMKSTTTTTTTTTTTPQIPWIGEAEDMGIINEEPLRCKAQYLGCFVTVTETANLKGHFTEFKMANDGDLKERCLDKCLSRKNHLAGYSDRMKTCVCSSSFDEFISSKKGGKWASVAWDKASRCRNPKSYHVYNVVRSCEKGVQDITVEDDLLGCVDIPKELRGIMIALTRPELKKEQCILSCELRKFTYAIPVLKNDICICSDSVSLFETADNMLKMTKVCNEKGDNKQAPVYKTVVEDQHCNRRFLNLGQAPPILLASYYGSGNTWIRHLIELSTGFYTGSVFNDWKLYEGGMLGEANDYRSGRTIAVKDHLFKYYIRPGYRMAILLLRNPYDATLAEWSRRTTKNHTGVTDPASFKSKAFGHFAEKRHLYWGGIVKAVLKAFDKVLVIYYEDLKENAVKQMRRLAKFLPDNVVPSEGEELERRLMCMNLDTVGVFKRPPRNLDFDPFNAFQRNNLDTTIREVDDLLITYHQPPLKDSYFLPF